MTNIDHKPETVLAHELQTAVEQVPAEAIYAHYKHPELLYKIIGHCILEASDEPAVLYQAQYGEKITYVRALGVFLETVEYEGKTVPRFTRVANESASE
jgi:hypothetical protein